MEFRHPSEEYAYREGTGGSTGALDETVGWGYWSGATREEDGESTEVDGPVYWLAAEPMAQAEIDGLEGPLHFNSYAGGHELHGMARTTAAGHFDLEGGIGGVELLFDPMDNEVSGRLDLFQEHDGFTEAWWAEFSGDLSGGHGHFTGESLEGGFTYLPVDGGVEVLSELAAESHVDILLIREDLAGGGFHLITAEEIEALGDEIQEAIGVFVIERSE